MELDNENINEVTIEINEPIVEPIVIEAVYPRGERGFSILSGAGVPSISLGINGDSYLNTDNGDTYLKSAGVWSVNGNIKGDPFTYEDFTPEQIEDLQRPALEAAVIANTATENANEATENANIATESAIEATAGAVEATENVISATEGIIEATEAAVEATNDAIEATENANTATTQADAARDGAITAASLAGEATFYAGEATTQANAARDGAITAKDNANTATTQANAARDGANTAKDNANTATSQANTARDSANTAASGANTATTNANNAASAASAVSTQGFVSVTSSRAITVTDKNQMLLANSAIPLTLTIPTNETEALVVGFKFRVQQIGVGNVVIAPAVGVTIDNPYGTLNTNIQYASFELIKKGTNLWAIELITAYIPKTDIVNDLTTGGTTNPLSAEQGKVLGLKPSFSITNENIVDWNETYKNAFKTLNVGSAGLVTISPSVSYATYKLTVLENVLINFDLNKMISQIGSARGRLILDMPILKTITFAKPILWSGTVPTFASAGQYVFEFINSDGNNPLIWQVASTLKAESTGVILYVDGATATYTDADITSGTATRLSNSWAAPFKYLQNAINAAIAGDIIFVKQGTYYPTHLRTSSTVFTAGDQLNRNATFLIKTGVDVYCGFVGTETKTWQRPVDTNGFPTNKTTLSGDILREAVIDGAKTVGDLRTDASKANAVYNVVYGGVTSYTYLNGADVKYGNANGVSNQSIGGGINGLNNYIVLINCISNNNSASYGGGWYSGTNTNCVSNNNNSGIDGGGWYGGTNKNCVASNNSASYGGGWYSGTNTNCVSNNNNVTSNGGGWYLGTNTNCVASNNSASNGGGWRFGVNTNCVASNNTTINSGGGWHLGTNTNCVAINNMAGVTGLGVGSGWNLGVNNGCISINNRGTSSVGVLSTDCHIINCLVFNNKNNSNAIVGFNNIAGTVKFIFRNNAYDTANPTITSSDVTSDINFSTCLPNVTLGQIKINVPSFIGATTNPAQLAELETFLANIKTNLKPKSGSILKGAGINNAAYPNPTDFEGTSRPTACTIGILEGL